MCAPRAYGILIPVCATRYASRYTRIRERLLKKSRAARRGNEIASTTAANYRNLRVFVALLRRQAQVYHYSARRLPWIPVSFCGNRTRRERETRARARGKICVQARMGSPVRTGRTYIRRFPPGKFITRLIEYRRMRSEKYYA